jgi:hypothetical protein
MALIYASPDGGKALFEGRTVKTFALNEALHRALPGDVVQLLPGLYQRAAVITDGGREDAPNTIRGNDGTVLDGGRKSADATRQFDPSDDDFAFFKIYTCSHLIIEQLSFINCWPSAVFMRDVNDIERSKLHIVGGRFATHARNKRANTTTAGVKSKRSTLDQVQ